jgi:hypothetical protein
MVRARLTELFTLSRALEIEAKLGADVRARIARALSLGEQKADAADSLWENGHSAEALRLAIAAVDATLEAVPIYAAAIGLEGAGESAGAGKGESAGAGEGESAGAGESASSPPARGRGQGRAAPSAQALIAPTLRSRGVSPREIAAIEAALEAARSAPLPGHESEITAAHTTLWRRTTAAQHALGRALGQASRSRLELLRKRVGRISGAVLGVAAVITVLVLVLRRPEGVFIEASGIWAGAASYAPELAIDGRDDTLWLAPDGVAATLDVTISPPRRVQQLRLVNGTSPPLNDRGTRDYRVELFVDGRIARVLEGRLDHPDVGRESTARPTVHELGLDRVERIRFVALTHYRIGAGLAELGFR